MMFKISQNVKYIKKYLPILDNYVILNLRKPCTPLVAVYSFNAHPARFFFCPNENSITDGGQK